VLYHYRLVAVPTAYQHPPYSYFVTGDDRWFRTLRERLDLLSTTLVVRHSAASVGLDCVSLRPCRGVLTLAVGGHSCASDGINVLAQSSRTISLAIAQQCARRLRTARAHRLTALLSTRLSGELPGPRKAVVLEGT
jgi:hypothetical protein